MPNLEDQQAREGGRRVAGRRLAVEWRGRRGSVRRQHRPLSYRMSRRSGSGAEVTTVGSCSSHSDAKRGKLRSRLLAKQNQHHFDCIVGHKQSDESRVCCLLDETTQTRISRYVRDVARLFVGQFSQTLFENNCDCTSRFRRVSQEISINNVVSINTIEQTETKQGCFPRGLQDFP